jgi:hypothetical protein
MIFKDDLGELLKKDKRSGKYVSYVVFTPNGGESTFADKKRALRDHAWNKRNKLPSQLCVFENWENPEGYKGIMIDCVDTLAAYKSEEL